MLTPTGRAALRSVLVVVLIILLVPLILDAGFGVGLLNQFSATSFPYQPAMAPELHSTRSLPMKHNGGQ
jgi:hypothetical protein